MTATFLVLVGLGLAAAADPAPEVLAARLGADTFAEREAAARALDALGVRALPALKAAADGADPETRRRARDLVRRIETRIQSDELLKPTRLRLDVRDASLETVLADLGRRAGLTLKAAGAATRRDVTLTTAEVSFWELFGRLSEATEIGDAPPPPPTHRVEEEGRNASFMMFGRGRSLPATDVSFVRADRPPELVLTAGRLKLPTCNHGAARIRLLPSDTGYPNQPRDTDDLLLVLDVALEGPTRWHRAAGVRLTRAVADDGTPLMPRPAAYRSPAGSRSGITVNGVPLDPEPDEPTTAGRLVPLLFRAPDKLPRRLKELAGVVVGQVRTEITPIVEVARILDAPRGTLAGKHGGSVRVIEVEKQAGSVVLRVFVEPAPRGLTSTPGLPFQGRIVVNGRTYSGDGGDLLNAANFAMTDADGKALRLVGAMATGRREGTAAEYELAFDAPPGVGPAATFVYRDRRMAFVEIPFIFKDATLRP